ncbi:unnamed protein product, partial [Nesidiocoris tenuis]
MKVLLPLHPGQYAHYFTDTTPDISAEAIALTSRPSILSGNPSCLPPSDGTSSPKSFLTLMLPYTKVDSIQGGIIREFKWYRYLFIQGGRQLCDYPQAFCRIFESNAIL